MGTPASDMIETKLWRSSRGAQSSGFRPAKDRARQLLAQIVTSAAAMETEKAVFRVRRDSVHANLLALGQVAISVLAARASGNWTDGAVAGVTHMADWDTAEGSRFFDRYQAESVAIIPALVELSLMSQGLNKASGRVTDALDKVGKARKQHDAKAAGKELAEAVSALRAEVAEFTSRKRHKRRARRGQPDRN